MEAWQGGGLGNALPPDAPELLASANIRTLILHARHDMRFPLSHAEQLQSAVPSSTLAVIEEAGHMAHWEQPEAWMTALTSFLSKPS